MSRGENRGAVGAILSGAGGGVPLPDCRSTGRVDTTTVHSQFLHLHGQRDIVALHGKLTDEREDHVAAEIAESSRQKTFAGG